MRINRRCWFAIAGTLLCLAVGIPAWAADETTLRWDLVHVTFMTTGNILDPGGTASALAQDGSKITLTGSGTFKLGESDDVTGGGTWTTYSSGGTSSGSGTYEVRRFIRFDGAPGVQTSNAVDHIGDGTLKDNRAGLAALVISYSDGSKGVLFVSCRLPGNPPPSPPPDAAPASIFEGVTASKGYTDYWNHVGPVAGVDAGRTLFHVLSHEG